MLFLLIQLNIIMHLGASEKCFTDGGSKMEQPLKSTGAGTCATLTRNSFENVRQCVHAAQRFPERLQYCVYAARTSLEHE